jgi:hypothetical protein
MIRIVPISLKQAKQAVVDWHAHHDPTVGHLFSIGAEVDDVLIGAVVVGRPVAPALQDGYTWEVTRLSCRGGDKNVASRLLAAAADASFARGIRVLVSYTRIDEDGACYRAAGWVEVAEVKGRDHTTGNRSLRWLPGFYEPSTEKIDRIRWERRPTEYIRAVVKMISALGRWASAAQRRRAA